MVYSTAWENMHLLNPIVVSTDINPWGGISKIRVLEGAKVKSVGQSIGSNFDNAVFSINESFGNELPYFQPIKIFTVFGTGETAKEVILFRGFVVKNSGRLSATEEGIDITCYDYKWYLSKRTMVRGRWYGTDVYEDNTFGSKTALTFPKPPDNPPTSFGSGMSSGDTNKLNYERFKARIANKAGYIQNQECVFNKGGLPDCCTKSRGSKMNVFYYPAVTWNETLSTRVKPEESQKWNGKYWTWDKIFSHINQYWLEPYFGTQVQVEISSGDIADIGRIKEEKARPFNFSIEGMNIVTAIDTTVRRLPGRWFWYMEYSSSNVIKIRIKEFDNSDDEVFLKVVDGDKLAESGANVTDLNVERDSIEGIKFAIAKGGSVKIVTTVRLYPMWQRFDGKDFRDNTDLGKYIEWARSKFYKSKDSENDKNKTITEETIEEKRWNDIYRKYGIVMEGENFSSTIQSEDEEIVLTGEISGHYSAFTKNIRKMFFKGVLTPRSIEGPKYGKYSAEPVVFLYDKYHDNISRSPDGVVRKIREQNQYVEDTAEDSNRTYCWINPKDESIGFKFDSITGVAIFDKPQVSCSRDIDSDSAGNDNVIRYLQSADVTKDKNNYNFPKSRNVYLTATFETNVAAIIGDKTVNSLIDIYSGAPFPGYIKSGSNDIVFHHAAFYPKLQDSQFSIDKETKCDGIPVYSSLKRCDKFDDYQAYVGNGATELIRALEAYLEGYNKLSESVTARIPWLDVGQQLGDRLVRIHGTEYDDLSSRLKAITFSGKDQSDFFETGLDFGNDYAKESAEDQYITAEHEKKAAMVNIRENFTLEGVDQ
jgi:hypothetical protein